MVAPLRGASSLARAESIHSLQRQMTPLSSAGATSHLIEMKKKSDYQIFLFMGQKQHLIRGALWCFCRALNWPCLHDCGLTHLFGLLALVSTSICQAAVPANQNRLRGGPYQLPEAVINANAMGEDAASDLGPTAALDDKLGRRGRGLSGAEHSTNFVRGRCWKICNELH